jgi:hypothetical protein
LAPKQKRIASIEEAGRRQGKEASAIFKRVKIHLGDYVLVGMLQKTTSPTEYTLPYDLFLLRLDVELRGVNAVTTATKL